MESGFHVLIIVEGGVVVDVVDDVGAHESTGTGAKADDVSWETDELCAGFAAAELDGGESVDSGADSGAADDDTGAGDSEGVGVVGATGTAGSGDDVGAEGSVWQIYSINPDTAAPDDVGTATVNAEGVLVSDEDAMLMNMLTIILAPEE